MDEQTLLARIAELAGIGAEDAGRVLRASLASLAEGLVDDEAGALAAELPRSLAPVVTSNAAGGRLTRDDLFERVAAREGVEIGFAVEHAESTLRALAERLSEPLLVRLRHHLPHLAPLLEAPEPPSPPPPYGTREGTLATGRPGSRHPVSASKPERAHAHSVARDDDPHGDTKLSGARGLTQEATDESLATAHGLRQEQEGRTLSRARR